MSFVIPHAYHSFWAADLIEEKLLKTEKNYCLFLCEVLELVSSYLVFDVYCNVGLRIACFEVRQSPKNIHNQNLMYIYVFVCVLFKILF